MLEEIEIGRLSKVRLDVEEPENMCVFILISFFLVFFFFLCDLNINFPPRDSYGRLHAYDKAYDRITTKLERPLQPMGYVKYNPTTSDDPVIQEV